MTLTVEIPVVFWSSLVVNSNTSTARLVEILVGAVNRFEDSLKRSGITNTMLVLNNDDDDDNDINNGT